LNKKLDKIFIAKNDIWLIRLKIVEFKVRKQQSYNKKVQEDEVFIF
jgi:hypothetical protein